MTEHIDLSAVPIAVPAPLNLVALAEADEGFPTFRSDHFAEMAQYVAQRLSSSGLDGVAIDPPTADDRPGRKLSVDGVAVCRVIGDPSDPRPFSTVVLGLLRTAASPATA